MKLNNETAVLLDKASGLDLLKKCVAKNGEPGSELRKAFALLGAVGDIDLDKGEDVARLANAVTEADRQWRKLSDQERRRILGGWNPRYDLPTKESHLRSLAEFIGPEVRWVLTADTTHENDVYLFADCELTNGTEPLRVQIVQGTTKEEALQQLRNIMAALEENWDAAIALNGKDGLTVKGVAPKLEVGALVLDTSGDRESGVIVGGFEGTNGWVYAYVTPEGEVQYQNAEYLEVAPGSSIRT